MKNSIPVDISIIENNQSEDIKATQELFKEYLNQIGNLLPKKDLIGFDEEISNLPGQYSQPYGALLIAKVDGQIAGCCAICPIYDVDYTNAAEMKRLFVRKAFRRLGLGRELVEAAMEFASQIGYNSILLDTLDEMESARALYEELGFEEIPPYYNSDIAGSHYLKADIEF